MDIVVKDAGGKVVRRYQAKYGRDAGATQELFEKGDYRGQRKLVPSGQEGDIAGSTDRLEVDGIRSAPQTKHEAGQLRDKAQIEQEIRDYEWNNDADPFDVAKEIGKQAMQSAAISCGFQGARILGRRLWQSLRGRENAPASEDLEEFFESSVKSAAHVGAQTAASGAVVVAARTGWIKALEHTPAGRIAGIVHVGIENAKVLFKFAKGELNGEEALDAMGTCTASAVGGLVGAGKGAAIGALIGGGLVGAAVGGVVGGIAGSKIGEAVYEAGKVIVKTAKKVVEAVVEGVVDTVKAVGREVASWFS